jgi:uncharacterized protein
MPILFEWDAWKAARNRKKHSISFEEASSVFEDPLSLTTLDPLHSSPGDERFVIVGRSAKERLLVVVHSTSGETIRIISARRATNIERRQYEEAL